MTTSQNEDGVGLAVEKWAFEPICPRIRKLKVKAFAEMTEIL